MKEQQQQPQQATAVTIRQRSPAAQLRYFQTLSHVLLLSASESLRQAAMREAQREADALCPQCEARAVIPQGAKYRCPGCGFIIPCCETEAPAR